MKAIYRTTASIFAAALMMSLGGPALAQDASDEDAADSAGDIVVTARRVEERLQDVPISITVFNQEQLSQRNIAVPSDLATYTPSLSSNTRFGPEKATFAIRGFNQDASTAPTVGVYFADVVGTRAQGGTAGGNTVGAGSFTDLQNVQVLKGPQGTLFGRNTTGGAILLVPKRPTSEFGGYLEGTYGNYDQKRVQGALNIPLAETFKVRLSFDRNERDGYMRNRSGIGPADYNDVNYFYGRLSILGELTPNLENTIIATYSRSDTNGYASHYEFCDPNAASPLVGGSLTRYYTSIAACEQIARQKARGDGPLDVEVSAQNPRIFLRQWQVINTTKWEATDTLTVKNTISYGEYREQSAFELYSDNFFVPNNSTTQFFAGRGGPLPGSRFQYIQLGTQPGYDAASGSTWTEELQLQGRTSDDRLSYVVGGYLEFSRPLGWNQQRTGIYGQCTDPGTLNCTGALPLVPLSASFTAAGVIVSESRTRFNFNNHGLFAQATYKFTDQLSLTGGFRYTFDTIDGYAESNRFVLATIPGTGTIPVQRVCNDVLNHPTVNLLATPDVSLCGTRIVTKSSKPTWLLGVDFKPTDDILVYAKWSRGYRQGTVNFTNPGIETAGPEKVDTYEVGGKFTFGGAVPGYFNVAAYYNNFRDQQIFGALIAKPNSGLSGGAAIINAGRSSIKGIEVDAGANLGRILKVSIGYSYLDTEIKELITPVLAANSPFQQIIPRGTVGGDLSYSPHHRLTASADLTIPTPEELGKITLGAIFTHTSSQLVDGNNRIPKTNLLNLNATWANIGGTGVDVIGFASNVTNQLYKTSSGGGFESSGIGDFMYGPPRMYGVRLRFTFGGG
ncbi:TonB-dependent receptor [Novosphingobium sp. MW5]|nr:TonB-dependent receptor [Novosphingobium sp. MW5]